MASENLWIQAIDLKAQCSLSSLLEVDVTFPDTQS